MIAIDPEEPGEVNVEPRFSGMRELSPERQGRTLGEKCHYSIPEILEKLLQIRQKLTV